VVTSPARRAHYVAQGWWDDTTLSDQVQRHARRDPDAIAVIDARGPVTRADLVDRIRRCAGGLSALGVEAGAVVSVQLPNVVEAAIVGVAVQSLGAIVNPLLPNYRGRELAHVFGTARPRVIVVATHYRGVDHPALVAEVSASTGVQPHTIAVDDSPDGGRAWQALLASGAAHRLGVGVPEAVSEIIFTSGTEATPKAILHTEQTASFSVRNAHTDLGVGDDDVVWMPSPVGHSTGFNYGLRFALHHGLPLVLQDAWDGDRALDLVLAHRLSYTLAATTFLHDLVYAARRRRVSLDSLRFFGCGGAPVPAALVDAATEVGARVLRLYGSTELLVASWNRGDSPLERRRHTDGRALSHVEIQLRDPDGAVVDPDQPGELFARGPGCCVGFFADVERTAATFDTDGWVRSGDLLTMTDDGYVTVVGRRKEILIRGGVNIAPREIEDLLVAMPEIERAAVVGLPDERLGERMCACVVLTAGVESLSLDDIAVALLATGLARYKLPERLEILTDLPMTASGKVQKHEIVRLLREPSR
jgi:non-ribosomal peptide synthetase component E (peptide arylation enzyme)